MSSQQNIERAAIWAAERYVERTKAIEDGRCENLDWVPPESRVVWSEICAQHGIGGSDVVDDRTAFQPLYEAELRKRGFVKKRVAGGFVWQRKRK